MKSLCVFCGSSDVKDPVFARAAKKMGELLAGKDITLVYGGGGIGLMRVVADAALDQGGKVIGVIPQALFDKELAHLGISELHCVVSMHERKKKMYDLSDAFVAIPGGLGTLDEIFEIITWAQLGIHAKPCGFLNVDGFFDPLIEFLDQCTEKGFIKPKYRALILVEKDPEILLQKFHEYHAAHLAKSVPDKVG